MRISIPVAVQAGVVDDRVENRRVGGFHEVGDEQLPNVARNIVILIEELQRNAEKAARIAGRSYGFRADFKEVDLVAENLAVLPAADFRVQVQNPFEGFKNRAGAALENIFDPVHAAVALGAAAGRNDFFLVFVTVEGVKADRHIAAGRGFAENVADAVTFVVDKDKAGKGQVEFELTEYLLPGHDDVVALNAFEG